MFYFIFIFGVIWNDPDTQTYWEILDHAESNSP